MEKCDGLVHPAAAKPREGCGRQDADMECSKENAGQE